MPGLIRTKNNGKYTDYRFKSWVLVSYMLYKLFYVARLQKLRPTTREVLHHHECMIVERNIAIYNNHTSIIILLHPIY